MKSNYKFSNLCGTVYRQGNVLFTSDGNSLVSPVGNRVSVFDLLQNKSRTFSFQNRRNIAAIALSPSSNVLISVDEDGRALLVNFKRGAVLHHFNFKKPVIDIQFSPNGKFIAVTHGPHVQVWNTPNHLLREFAPFELHRTYTGHHDDVISIEWTEDSRFFLTTSRDMTARLYTLNPLEGYKPKTFSGHRDIVLHAYFSRDNRIIYTISRDGAVFVWRKKSSELDDEPSSEESDTSSSGSSSSSSTNAVALTRWGIDSRHYFNQAHTKVTVSTWHAASNLLVVGFSTGVFGLWEMPDFTNIHTLNISQERISSVAINPSGEWLAFGAKKLGQLLVWEWQSESYVLKQQGHYFDMNTLSYSSDGQNIATGGDDGKVKVWNSTSGFCFVTFSEHTASVSAVEFAKRGQVLFTASLDGTIRGYDLTRYRNFRTFTSPSPVQFSCLAVDPSGEVVAGGSTDSFEVFMWSVQTGKLLDVLTGHEAPISCLSFSPTGNIVVSGSWDRSVRLWNVFGRSKHVEPFSTSSEVLAIAFRPDGREVAVSTLDGQITFWDVDAGKQTNLIEGRKDASGGRKQDDLVTAANSASTKSFNSLAYTADGLSLVAGGNSKYVVIYDVRGGVMVKRFSISENLSLDGTEEFLDSRRETIDGVDNLGDESELEDRLDTSLPGAAKGDLSKRKYRPEVRTKAVRFSPTGRSWAAATTDGLLVYSVDDDIAFDPVDLDIDLTPEAVLTVLRRKEFLKALIMSFRLNEKGLIRQCFESIPVSDIQLVARLLPTKYLEAMLALLADHMESTPHMEFDLIWSRNLMMAHGRHMKDNSAHYASGLRSVQRALVNLQVTVAKISEENTSILRFLLDQARLKGQGGEKMEMALS